MLSTHGPGTAPRKARRLYAGSILGGTLHSWDLKTKEHKIEVPSPSGGADDVAYRKSDGMLAWTVKLRGEVWVRFPDGRIELAAELHSTNPIKVQRTLSSPPSDSDPLGSVLLLFVFKDDFGESCCSNIL